MHRIATCTVVLRQQDLLCRGCWCVMRVLMAPCSSCSRVVCSALIRRWEQDNRLGAAEYKWPVIVIDEVCYGRCVYSWVEYRTQGQSRHGSSTFVSMLMHRFFRSSQVVLASLVRAPCARLLRLLGHVSGCNAGRAAVNSATLVGRHHCRPMCSWAGEQLTRKELS